MITRFELDTPIGVLGAATRDAELVALFFDAGAAGDVAALDAALTARFGEAGRPGDGGSVRARLVDYFAGDAGAIDALAADPGGTPFQRAVWDELRRIPRGTTISYGELARRVGRPAAVRAAGAANGANPIAVVVPCHRVVASTGHLHGYGGGLGRKRWLLEHEGALLALGA